jgi:hypothetical protein
VSERLHEEATAARIADAADEVRAPATLRASVAELRLRSAPARRGRLRVAAGVACVAVLVAVAAVLTLPNGESSPSISDVAAVSLLGPHDPAPSSAADEALPLAVDGVHFPGAGPAGWRPAGVRSDEVAGRSARTVTYRRGKDVIGYTIVAGPALRAPQPNLAAYEGVSAAVFRRGDALVLTWRRGGRTCVLVSRDVGARRMLELAARS